MRDAILARRNRKKDGAPISSQVQPYHIRSHPPPTITSYCDIMAPKQQRVIVQKADPRRPTPKGYLASAYNSLTSPENASVVRSVAVFGVRDPIFPPQSRQICQLEGLCCKYGCGIEVQCWRTRGQKRL